MKARPAWNRLSWIEWKSWLTAWNSIDPHLRLAERDSPLLRFPMIQMTSSPQRDDINMNVAQHSLARGTSHPRAPFSVYECSCSCTGTVCSSLLSHGLDRMDGRSYWRDLRAKWCAEHAPRHRSWNWRIQNAMHCKCEYDKLSNWLPAGCFYFNVVDVDRWQVPQCYFNFSLDGRSIAEIVKRWNSSYTSAMKKMKNECMTTQKWIPFYFFLLETGAQVGKVHQVTIHDG